MKTLEEMMRKDKRNSRKREMRKQINLFAWNDTIQKLFELSEKADRKREIVKKVRKDQNGKKD